MRVNLQHLDKTLNESTKNILEGMLPLDPQESLSKINLITHGNMNLTQRVFTDKNNTYIVKQGRNFVEKYPDIKAPVGRTTMEYLYLKELSQCSVMSTMSPKVIHFDEENQILILEDLGDIQDGIVYYSSGSEIPNTLEIQDTHKWENKKMRELNAFHMFEFPFSEQGLEFIQNQMPELLPLRSTAFEGSRIHETRKNLNTKYLSTGKILVHGDFYPGSWVSKQEQLFVIDPEFCFAGYPEFDWGVLLAHGTMLSSKNSSFIEQHITKTSLDHALVYQHASIEIMRRMFGVAQLPFTNQFSSLSTKEKWVHQALDWLH